MEQVKNLKCLLCGHEYGPDEVLYVCPNHGTEGILDVQYDYDLITSKFSRTDLKGKGESSLWRYKPLLPVKSNTPVPPLTVGWTPLYPAPRLAKTLGLEHLWVKDDCRQPTASFKDRASLIAIVKALEVNAEVITTASTGNAAAALSGLCASIGMPNVIFVPASAPEAKIAQLMVFGSTVLLIEGTYDDAFDLCLESAQVYGWYIRNTGYNPYMTEGKKTALYEIYEQLEWEGPDAIFVPVGDGCIIGGLHKGLKDLFALGWIKKMPRLIGVQASGSAAMYHAWKQEMDPVQIKPIKASTIADSMASGLPRDRIKAMRAVRETGGAFLAVTDEEILQAIPALARGCGVFAEPAGASSFAGLVKAVQTGLVRPEERIVILATGSGLKDIPAAMQTVGKPKRIRASLKAVEAALDDNLFLLKR
ncbi:MAG: threonine synthase [Deltaproteobacteria bacterium RBG_16_49_23]|nr:MAG: threonine synthase [Deltaproteobacteria bacterium RBG_16_49_23]